MSEVVYSNVLQTGVWGLSPQPAVAIGGLGAKPSAAGRFLCFWKRKASLIPLDHVSHEFTVI